MADIDIKAYARVGAVVRLNELSEERAAILQAFPELRGGTATPQRVGRRRGRPTESANQAKKANKAKKRTMSAEARRLISEAQKKRWAAQKAAGAKTAKKAKKAKASKGGRKATA